MPPAAATKERSPAAAVAAISSRGRHSPRSAIRKLTPFADAAKAQGVTVYPLNIGQPDIETPEVVLRAVRAFSSRVLAYGPSRGLPGYVAGLCRYYGDLGFDVTPEQVVVTTGGSEALLFALMVVANPGDAVAVPEPFYTNYNSFAHQAGVAVAPITTRAETGFHLPPRAAIEAALPPNARALLFSNPGNPTGTVFRVEEVRMLADVARARGLFLIADEVYREFVFDGRAHASVLAIDEVRDRAILIDSSSKRYSCCGARVGALVCKNREVIDAVVALAEARLCPPTLGQQVGEEIVAATRDYLESVRGEYARRRDLVYDRLSAIPGAVLHRPEGAFYATVKLPIDDSDAFAKWLLTDFRRDGQTVFVAPGTGFYATPGLGKQEVRVAYVLNAGDLARAMDLLAAGVAAYPGRRSAAGS
ncbi:MAG: pyridoxal phosphate-dependent aminotransferase [Planctomycetes bacterium]|nr:pyridoxal phosphate-dependent aminotransferase [Planctomycetota bacterium]